MAKTKPCKDQKTLWKDEREPVGVEIAEPEEKVTVSDPPPVGYWRPIQEMVGKVIQWAYTCPICKETIFVLNEPAKKMKRAGIRERCHAKPDQTATMSYAWR